MDHGLEADERPWNHGEDGDDLLEASALGRKRRPHRREAPVVPRERRCEHGDHARDEHAGEERVKSDCEPLAEKAHRTAEGDCEDAEHDFPEIHVESGQRVVETELERVAEKVPHEEHERGGVGP